MKAWTYRRRRQRQSHRGRDSRRSWRTPRPPARDALIEMVAEADDALMEKFFEAGTLTQEELVAGLHTATLNGKVLSARVRVSRC